MALEHAGPRIRGTGERFVGYGVPGLTFEGGDVLAFRRVTGSSSGIAYSALWHRDPGRRWTVFTTVSADTAEGHYGRAIHRVHVADVRVQWTGADRVALSVPAHHVEWAIRLEPTVPTRLFNRVSPLIPGRARAAMLAWLGSWSSRELGIGSPRGFTGVSADGHRFRIEPRHVWLATASAATLEGRDLGPIGPQGPAARFGERVLPERGLFVTGREIYELPSAALPGGTPTPLSTPAAEPARRSRKP